jgi:hypothetical protein
MEDARMLWKCSFRLGLLALLGGAAAVQAQAPLSTFQPVIRSGPVYVRADPAPAAAPPATPAPAPGTTAPPAVGTAPTPEATSPGNPETRAEAPAADQGTTPPAPPALGPTPLLDVKILQGLVTGDDPNPWLHMAGWADFDYTYRSTGKGINNVAPVMNRFGDEFLTRQLGLYLFKPLDEKTWSWGFNSIFIGGADASFLTPIGGGYKNTNPRFGSDFTDLNVTAHLPVLTDGGIDVKAGRQTTVLGPMGALPWQRYFDSSDYAWYNMEEGRFTGVSAVWHVSKRLDWYNGFEEGWGSFFDDNTSGVDYITQLTYWLDEEAKNTKVWTTVLTGPTSQFSGANTTVLELGIQHNWSPCVYQIVDTQMVWSKGPVAAPVPPGYNENAYDVYTYLGTHVNKCLDLNSRLEWYDDVDGLGYAGGFGNHQHTNYYEVTLGPDYHPYKWIQFRPEIRYDYASHANFGPNNDQRSQLSLAAEVLFKF